MTDLEIKLAEARKRLCSAFERPGDCLVKQVGFDVAVEICLEEIVNLRTKKSRKARQRLQKETD
jgi:hypothetical protein